MVQRLVLIANPVASGFTASLHREVVATLTGPYDVTPVWPNGPEDARRAAADAAAAGYDVVVAMGGDGVAHEVANGLVGSSTALGVVPAGTTNVLARMLGLPRKPRDAAGCIADMPGTHRIPVAGVEDDSASGIRSGLALFNTGVGLDAAIVRRAEERPLSKVSLGALHYARATSGVVLGDFRRRRPDLTVEIDRVQTRAASVLIQVQDVYTYFGRFPMRLGSSRSGLTVAVLERTPTIRMIRTAYRALRGTSVGRVRGVTVWEDVPSVTILADDKALMQADGELLGQISAATVTARPDALLVVAPRPAA